MNSVLDLDDMSLRRVKVPRGGTLKEMGRTGSGGP